MPHRKHHPPAAHMAKRISELEAENASLRRQININLEPTSAFVIGQTMKRYADKLILAGRKGPA